MKKLQVGYGYSLAPIHCGGEGDLGNILEIAREVHTNFPYIPGSSLRGSVRNELLDYQGPDVTDRLFGRELTSTEQMGVHQVWFGDARLLWVPMRTLASQGKDVFMWVSCPALLRDHALISGQAAGTFTEQAVGDQAGQYMVADAKITVQAFSPEQKQALTLAGNWPENLGQDTQKTWANSRLVLADGDFQILLEHALWTQIRNKIQDSGGAEVFWTDVCIPRDTIFYYAWGYQTNASNPLQEGDRPALEEVLTGLIQVGGQANVGRGWLQSWIGSQSTATAQTPAIAK
jgi:CRISPR-associated protein Cmr4